MIFAKVHVYQVVGFLAFPCEYVWRRDCPFCGYMDWNTFQDALENANRHVYLHQRDGSVHV